VDDKDANIKAFREYGGYGVTVPRPWNMLQGTKQGGVTSITAADGPNGGELCQLTGPFHTRNSRFDVYKQAV
jgi:hypothetical protein